MWDPYRLEQVVVNLLDNALKCSPDGGEVRVTLHGEDGEVVMDVLDKSIGVPAEAIPLLFEPFARASNVSSRQFGGLGLGLFISRQVVDRHGGSIEVHSELGEGTRFRVRLPKAVVDMPDGPGVALH
jgi:signal transduction histidine kinase